VLQKRIKDCVDGGAEVETSLRRDLTFLGSQKDARVNRDEVDRP